jgi:hypothetical protein
MAKNVRFEWELSFKKKDRVTTRSIYYRTWETWHFDDDYIRKHKNWYEALWHHFFGRVK